MTRPHLVNLKDNDGGSATIAPELGGWLLRYSRELVEHGRVEALHFDPAVVERYPREMYAGSPVLFPLASFNHLAGRDHHYEWQGRVYEMPQHGFARRRPWTVLDQTDASVTMELTDSEATLAQYPFEFSLRLTYRLAGGQLFWEQKVINRSPEALPFSTGFHPYFSVPLTSRGLRSECFVEIPDCRRLTMHGRGEGFTAKPFPSQNWSVAEDVSNTLFLTDLKRRELILADPISALEVVLDWRETPAFRFVAIWSKSIEAPFFCLEPWTAVSNPFTRAKERELIVLEPGGTFDAAFRLELRETQ